MRRDLSIGGSTPFPSLDKRKLQGWSCRNVAHSFTVRSRASYDAALDVRQLIVLGDHIGGSSCLEKFRDSHTVGEVFLFFSII